MVKALEGGSKFGWCLDNMHNMCPVVSAYGLECVCTCTNHGIDREEDDD